ncbi:MAG: dipeptidase, partial [Sandaracinobacteroides sp.]
MLRLTGRIAIALAGVALLLFFAVAPSAFERLSNPVVPDPSGNPWPVSERALALHSTLRIVDLHGDTLMWKRDPLKRADRGHADVPRLADGNVGLQIFSSVSKVPRGQNYESNPSDTDVLPALAIGQLQPLRTWFSPLERSLWHASRLRTAAESRPQAVRLILSAADLDRGLAARANGKAPVLALLSLEGMQGVGTDRAKFDRLFDAGFRMGGLAHFFDNAIAGSVHGEAKGGLTPFGREVVAAMQAKGMVVDVAHASHAAIADVLAMSTTPVVASHGGVTGTCNNNRNLTDAEIRGIAGTGGVVGIGLWATAVCATTPGAAARAMRHVRDVGGIGAVALGSDFDGSVATPFDATGLAALTQA